MGLPAVAAGARLGVDAAPEGHRDGLPGDGPDPAHRGRPARDRRRAPAPRLLPDGRGGARAVRHGLRATATCRSKAIVYNQAGYLEAGWATFYILWGAAALHGSMRDPVGADRRRRPAALAMAAHDPRAGLAAGAERDDDPAPPGQDGGPPRADRGGRRPVPPGRDADRRSGPEAGTVGDPGAGAPRRGDRARDRHQPGGHLRGDVAGRALHRGGGLGDPCVGRRGRRSRSSPSWPPRAEAEEVIGRTISLSTLRDWKRDRLRSHRSYEVPISRSGTRRTARPPRGERVPPERAALHEGRAPRSARGGERVRPSEGEPGHAGGADLAGRAGARQRRADRGSAPPADGGAVPLARPELDRRRDGGRRRLDRPLRQPVGGGRVRLRPLGARGDQAHGPDPPRRQGAGPPVPDRHEPRGRGPDHA